MTDKAPALTSDQIDELLLSARYGDLEDLESTLAPLLSSASSASSMLASIKNESANTLLHYACANGHLDVVTYLLPHSDLALLLAQNESGNTPLHWAALNGHLDTVKALVAHIEKLEAAHPEEAKKLNLIFHPKSSAHPEQPNEAHEGDQNDGSERKLWDVRNSAGRGPMSEAQMREQEAIVKFLLERMIDGPEGSNLTPAEPLPSSNPTATSEVEDKTQNLSLNT
ncbi:hypothetical protein PaG_01258 [Moesziomyces aphidis]|jgi:ankyrin repeat protein|uniref:Uncharacterized protein n=1 Tax=Moesziomyces aphidis TaxID=84754 RepID=W3VSC6_MOEAP|nr:hypothetical protein PaG_01258 [Moesziomyces aphidis]